MDPAPALRLGAYPEPSGIIQRTRKTRRSEQLQKRLRNPQRQRKGGEATETRGRRMQVHLELARQLRPSSPFRAPSWRRRRLTEPWKPGTGSDHGQDSGGCPVHRGAQSPGGDAVANWYPQRGRVQNAVGGSEHHGKCQKGHGSGS